MADEYDEDDFLSQDDDTGAAASTALANLELALDGPLRPLTPAVFIPPGMRVALAGTGTERQILEEAIAKGFGRATYEDQLLRIDRDVDPVGMAIAIVQGMAIPVYVPQAGGGVKVSYVSVSTRERMKLLNKLLDRTLPPQSPVKPGKKPEELAAEDPIGFLSAVQRAATLARQRMQEARVVDATSLPNPETRDPEYDEASLVDAAQAPTSHDLRGGAQSDPPPEDA